MLTFVVRGVPVPQGALVRSPAGGLYHRGQSALDAWRGAIGLEARAAMGDFTLFEGPVRVTATFSVARPAAHFLPANGKRRVRELRLDAPAWHAQRLDIDKLSRALLDALTGVVVGDDGQVAELTAAKRWADAETGWTGVVVQVGRLAASR